MNNHRDILGLVFNAILVACLLLAIIIGLNFMGLYDLPDWIEKIFGTYSQDEQLEGKDENFAHESITYDIYNNVTVETTEITYENAKQLLSAVEPFSDYSHKITVEYFRNGKSSYIEHISAVRDDGQYSATISGSSGTVLKDIKYSGDIVEVSDYNNGNKVNSVTVPVGDFDISDECGFILNADNFTSSDYVLDEASYALTSGSYGAHMTVTFESTRNDYTQKEIYTISLDYGVVVSAQCYEDDVIVYSMKTEALTR